MIFFAVIVNTNLLLNKSFGMLQDPWSCIFIQFAGIRTWNLISVTTLKMKFNIDFVLYLTAEEQDALQASSSTAQQTSKRKRQPRKCRKCGQPVKDHDDQACKSNQQ